MDESAVSGPESGAATTGAPSSSAASGGDSASDSTSVLRAALIHNDYKYDNLVLDPDDPTRILAVLDWENERPRLEVELAAFRMSRQRLSIHDDRAQVRPIRSSVGRDNKTAR